MSRNWLYLASTERSASARREGPTSFTPSLDKIIRIMYGVGTELLQMLYVCYQDAITRDHVRPDH